MHRIFTFLLLPVAFILHAQNEAADTLIPSALSVKYNCSKERYPAAGSFAPPADLFLAATYYQSKKMFSGFVKDKHSLAQIEKGRVIYFHRILPGTEYVFRRRTDKLLYATDSTFDDGHLVRAGEYYNDAKGYWKITSEFDKDGHRMRRSSERFMKEEHGVCCFANSSMDGLQEVFDTSGVLTESYFTNTDLQRYGNYYSFDPLKKLVTNGQYSNGGESGQWTVRNQKQELLRADWYGLEGRLDSEKTWFEGGNRASVFYDYEDKDRTPVQYAREWYANGKPASVSLMSVQGNDTLWTQWNEAGMPVHNLMMLGKYKQERTWYDDGTPKLEKYGDGLRDSVYREWNAEGKLEVEKLYRKGWFVRSSFPLQANPVLADTALRRKMQNTAYQFALATTAAQKQNWDTALCIPKTVSDSLCDLLMETYAYWQKAKPARGMQWYAGAAQERVYMLYLKGLSIDSLHPFSSDPQIIKLMNSCGFKSVQVKHSNFSYVLLSGSPLLLNTGWINRELDLFAPGSSFELSNAVSNVRLRIFPVGTKDRWGKPIPFAVIAFFVNESEAGRRDESIRTPPQYYQLVYRYIDGDMETGPVLVSEQLEDEYRLRFFQK